MKDTHFGRCIFLSWYCEKGTCNFCFRSTLNHKIKFSKSAKRGLSSILTDAIIGKNLGWEIEFLTGGYGIFEFDELVKITKCVSEIYGHKIWVNLGVLKEDEMKKLKPYMEGVCASIETVEPKLHNSICPDKPIEPYSKMLKTAKKLGFKTGITIVIGLGEDKKDFNLLKEYIKEHELDQITFYALKPIQGTPHTKSPEPEYYAWWISQTRKEFPKLKIMAGLTPKRVDYTRYILEAGADNITKFPAVGLFNSKQAKQIEEQIKLANRKFKGSLTKLPDINWDKEVSKLPFDDSLKNKINLKLKRDLKVMAKPKP